MTNRAPRCPECKSGRLSLVRDGLVGRFYIPGYHVRGAPLPPARMEPAPFFACNACEFCIEVNPKDLSGVEPMKIKKTTKAKRSKKTTKLEQQLAAHARGRARKAKPGFVRADNGVEYSAAPAAAAPAPDGRTREQVRHDAAVKAAATKRRLAGLPPLGTVAPLSTTTPAIAPNGNGKATRRKAPAAPAAAPTEADTSGR